MNKLYIIIVIVVFIFSFSGKEKTTPEDKKPSQKKLYHSAQVYYSKGKYDQALILYKQLIKMDSVNFDYNYELCLNDLIQKIR